MGSSQHPETIQRSDRSAVYSSRTFTEAMSGNVLPWEGDTALDLLLSSDEASQGRHRQLAEPILVGGMPWEPKPKYNVDALGNVSAAVISLLCQNRILAIQNGLEVLYASVSADLPNCVKLGSMCTGSGAGPQCWDELGYKMSLALQVPVRISHEFACEISYAKQSWIKGNGRFRRLFEDVRTLFF